MLRAEERVGRPDLEVGRGERGLIREQAVVAWVEGAKGKSWWAPVLIVTNEEVVWVKRGIITKKAHRVPRRSVSSVAYSTGLIWDTLVLNVAGGDLPDTRIRINRSRRHDAQAVLAELRKDAS